MLQWKWHLPFLCISLFCLVVVSQLCLFILLNWSKNAQSTSFFSFVLSDLLMRLRVSTEFERNGRLEGSRWDYLPPDLPPPRPIPDPPHPLNVGFRLSSSTASRCSTGFRRNPAVLCFRSAVCRRVCRVGALAFDCLCVSVCMALYSRAALLAWPVCSLVSR